MEMPKASDEDKERFRFLVPDNPEVVVKPMFGNLGAFVNGNMFAGLFGPTVGVKLSSEDREALESTERTVPFGPAERPMGGYTGLPEVWNAEGDGDEARARAWVEKAFAYVAELPPKATKAKAPQGREEVAGSHFRFRQLWLTAPDNEDPPAQRLHGSGGSRRGD
jgi:TfoX/Sxy family transcriptional regulator of competence genes